MKKEELMKQYEELKGKGNEPDMIFLYIHMPTGETETIVNPNVEEKMKSLTAPTMKTWFMRTARTFTLSRPTFVRISDQP